MHRIGRSTSTTSTGSASATGLGAYGQSKLANLLFTSELQRRLNAVDSPLLSTAAHPGYAATNLQSHSDSGFWELVMGKLATTSSPSRLPPARCNTVRGVRRHPGGQLRRARRLSGDAWGAAAVGRSKRAWDTDVARRLWEVSEELTATRFPL